MREQRKEIALYIHIPFCRSKCFYCDFNSYAGIEELIPQYVDAVTKEISLYAGRLSVYIIKSIFIGGGTPSLLDSLYISKIIKSIKANLNVAPGAEITIEANPGTLNREKLFTYHDAGINRLSMGVQAWQDRLLKKIGRIHANSDFLDNIHLAREAGFNNINLDLIFGLPQQSLADWNETVSNIISLNPEHLSCYSLLVEEGTVFGDLQSKGELAEIDEETDRAMYQLAMERLGEAGLNHYEISNFARPGFECRHNLVYWNAEEYAGVGAGAHSYLEGKRFNNISGVREYNYGIKENGTAVENIEEISIEEAMSEFMILGLRLIDGIRPEAFRQRFGKDLYSIFGESIDRLLQRKLLWSDDKGIRLSRLGLDLANQVFVEFI